MSCLVIGQLFLFIHRLPFPAFPGSSGERGDPFAVQRNGYIMALDLLPDPLQQRYAQLPAEVFLKFSQRSRQIHVVEQSVIEVKSHLLQQCEDAVQIFAAKKPSAARVEGI
jgi:hypothetical protein